MKKTLWLLVGLVIPASVLAQELTNAPASQPTGTSSTSTNPPATQRRAAAELRTVPLVPGPAVVVGRNVNVRGKAGLKGEVITQVTKGDQVTVIEEITLPRSAADEPSAWAKIVLPPGAHVWANANFINRSSNTVIPRRLNLRGGPGENYSVLGQLERGDTVKIIQAKDEWVEIEHPTNAYAFMAAQYLEQVPAATVAETKTPTTDTHTTGVATTTIPTQENQEAPVTTATVTEGPEVKAATNVPEVTPTTTSPESGTVTGTDTWTTTNEVVQPPEPEEPQQPRIVQREGVVRGTISIQAPTRYELWSPESGKVINYLYTTAAALDLSRYKGLRIVVTGEEALDERWRNTPVITIQKIVVLD